MVQKIPPPPFFTGPEWHGFNRWLLEVTSILSNEGGINPDEVSGLPALFNQVDTNTADITTLESDLGGQGSQIQTLQIEVIDLTNQITVLNGQVTTLSARPQVLNGTPFPPSNALGNDNDWYASTGGTKHIYVKLAGAWVQIV